MEDIYCVRLKITLFFYYFGEVMIVVSSVSLTLLKVNLDSTVETYKRLRKKKKKRKQIEKQVIKGVELFWVCDKWLFVSSNSTWDWKLDT